jgi:hypothetical protein
LQIATFFLIPLILVRVFGNSFGRQHHEHQ